ncbi:hypothetical protein ONE63_002142 [Megalurothrips usitatus]|uniref:UV-stimulated scaffold protein A C-terminal domain-containing protein n=1 Tax=Megalurothrips usitatus TaxID=439358 RepID=A0AAV7XEX5_9NEOP|nr:hypothetical protein ONE63_002142 [Megalurothrips usitatus]
MEASPSKNSEEHFHELKKQIATLTHTGEKVLDPPVLKAITRICKLSNDYVIHAYNLLMGHLEAKHSEVRLSCFQICFELFKRSHCFRELVVANLEHIMELTAETKPSKPLPPPRSAALSLKKFSLTTIRDWAKQYGSGYKKLQLGISFLRNCKKVDLNAMALEEAAVHSRERELIRRKKAIQNERFKKVVDELKEKQSDIVSALTEMENCLGLLLPSPEDFFIESDSHHRTLETEKNKNLCKTGESSHQPDKIAPKPSEESSSSDSEGDEEYSSQNPIFDFRKYGIINPHFSITLKVDPSNDPLVEKTEENASIFENAQDLFKVVSNRYQPCIVKWETIIEKCSDLETSSVIEISRRVHDLKSRLELVLDKYRRLNIEAFNERAVKKDDEDSDTSDSDFEEVQNKDGFEEFSKSAAVKSKPSGSEPGTSQKRVPKRPIALKKDWSLVSDENNEKDPTSILSTLSELSRKNTSSASTSTVSPEEQKSLVESMTSDEIPGPSDGKHESPNKESGPSDERKSKLLSIAPKLPFDIDLYHWEDEKVEAPTRLTVKPDGHRFWVATADDRGEIRDPDGEASIRTRVIEFTGNFQKVKWACRAPLPSGKLCPRKDRVKCPFHGKVIARDDSGKPSNPDDQKFEDERLEAERANKVPDWQDPKLLAELKESTGVDLRMPDKSKRGWRKHLPGEKKEYVGLTDIKATQNTTYNRLSKKVFQKSSMKRVAADLDKLDKKRFRDKYGDQFNYVFDR